MVGEKQYITSKPAVPYVRGLLLHSDHRHGHKRWAPQMNSRTRKAEDSWPSVNPPRKAFFSYDMLSRQSP